MTPALRDAVARLVARLALPVGTPPSEVVDAHLTMQREAGEARRLEREAVDRRRQADAAAAETEAAIQAFFDETGAAEIQGATHTLSIWQTPAAVIITDRDALPAEFRRQPEWQPDKTAIKRALADGQAVAGATLSNGGTTFRILPRRPA